MRSGPRHARSAARVVPSALIALLLLGGGTTHGSDPVRTFFASSFSVSDADFDRLDKGHVVSRTLHVGDKREIATMGIVRMKITPEFYVERLADIASFKRDEAVLQIGTFGNPPDLQDVTGLTLDESDLRNLRACRVGNCGVQLSEHAIQRFRQESTGIVPMQNSGQTICCAGFSLAMWPST